MSEMPSLTVLMTVHNGMPYLMEAVRSVLAQDMNAFTFLILNNGSSDGTRSFLEDVERRHGKDWPRLSIVHLPENIGRTAVLNRGLSMVETELTAILDADDLALTGRLRSQAEFFRDNPDVDLLGADITYIDGTGNAVGGETFPRNHDSLRDLLPLFNQFAHSACMFRTRAALSAGGYPQGFPYAQDLALWIAMMARGSRAASLPQTLAGVRKHAGQATRDLSLLMVRRADDHALCQAMLDLPGLSRSSRQAARLRSTGALYRLGRRGDALRQAWMALREAPLHFPANPVLWRRLFIQARRWLHTRKRS